MIGGRCPGFFGTEAGGACRGVGGEPAQRAPFTPWGVVLASSVSAGQRGRACFPWRSGESALRGSHQGVCLTDGGVTSHLQGQAEERKTLRGCPSAGVHCLQDRGWQRRRQGSLAGHTAIDVGTSGRVGTSVSGHGAGNSCCSVVERVLEMRPRRGCRMN